MASSQDSYLKPCMYKPKYFNLVYLVSCRVRSDKRCEILWSFHSRVDVSQLRLESDPSINESSDSDDSSPLCLTPAESRIDQEVQLNNYGDFNEVYSPLPLPPTCLSIAVNMKEFTLIKGEGV